MIDTSASGHMRVLEGWQKLVLYSALKGKAEKAHPDEYRRASKKYTFDDYWAGAQYPRRFHRHTSGRLTFFLLNLTTVMSSDKIGILEFGMAEFDFF